MRELDAKEVQRVFSKCSEPIDKLINDYKKRKGLSDFKPVIKFYPIDKSGFLVLFLDNNKEAIGSIFNMQGNMIFSPYLLNSDGMN